MKIERTLILIKPDAIQRSLLGEIISRFERKGLKIIGLKMMKLEEEILVDHYSHHKDKPFFRKLIEFMKSGPIVAMVLEGVEAIETVRNLVGSTNGRKADPGTIRGDFSMSQSFNIIHASDSKEIAEIEIRRFFKPDEIFDYQKIDFPVIYSKDDLED
jgi:nucleoside-diphosphate kinase